MILKKIILGVFLLSFLGGCAQNAALLGPAYTLVTSGNMYHAGFTYGGNQIITSTTGKSIVKNLEDSLVTKKKRYWISKVS